MSRVSDPKRPSSLSLLELQPELHIARLGRVMWISDRSGAITGRGVQGIYAGETRLLSRYRWLIDDAPLRSVTWTTVEPGRVMGYALALPPGADGDGDARPGPRSLTEQCLALEVERTLDQVITERLVLTNYTPQAVCVTLALELEASFDDGQEALEGPHEPQGRCRQHAFALEAGRGLRFDYEVERDEDGVRVERSVELRFVGSASPPRFDEGRSRMRFDVALEPGQRWSGRVELEPGPQGRLHPEAALAERDCPPRRERLARGLAQMARLSMAGERDDDLTPVALCAFERACMDLTEQRLYELDGVLPEDAWTLAAGAPLHLSLFGRDPLTAAWQGAMADPGMLPGTLHALAHRQGTERDDSSIASLAFYPAVLGEAWHWHGDEAMVRRFIEPALRALHGIETHHRGDDGFYYGRSGRGWKDAAAGIVDDAHGRVLGPPLAACAEQGVIYRAKLEMAELLWWLDEQGLARRLYQEARELKLRFNERFWMADERYYAMAMRPDGQQVRSIGSNAGHCLAMGIIDDARVGAVAERLLADDLFSGWGVRTLSTRNPAYNPFSDHRGTVWPVENATFALGFTRFGLHEHTQRLARAMFETSALFAGGRLPERFGGQPRDAEHPVPGFHVQSNGAQAGSASAVILLVQAMLGLYPYAPLHMLVVDPHLPGWLPRLRLDGVRVGQARVSLSFERESSGRTSCRVEDLEGTLHVVRQPTPWSLTAGPLERTRGAFESLLPGH